MTIRNFPDGEHDRDMVESLAGRIVNAGKKCCDENGVPYIKFMSILRRVARTQNNRERFTRCMGYFNDEVRRQCDYEPGLLFKPVDGFACHLDGSTIWRSRTGLQMEPIQEWTLATRAFISITKSSGLR